MKFPENFQELPDAERKQFIHQLRMRRREEARKESLEELRISQAEFLEGGSRGPKKHVELWQPLFDMGWQVHKHCAVPSGRKPRENALNRQCSMPSAACNDNITQCPDCNLTYCEHHTTRHRTWLYREHAKKGLL
ncbi:MAG: hypothetical protein ACPHID_06905 [Thermoplasmatota archaeon]